MIEAPNGLKQIAKAWIGFGAGFPWSTVRKSASGSITADTSETASVRRGGLGRSAAKMTIIPATGLSSRYPSPGAHGSQCRATPMMNAMTI